MLDGLGVLGNREPDAIFSEWLGDLTAEVARDLYLRRYAAAGDPPFEFVEASRVADRVVSSPHARLVPRPPADDGGPDGPEPAWLRRLAYASAIRAEVDARKIRARLFGYDDMLTRLRDALADPRTGPLAAARLRQRYRIVLVDEFQDTDVVQWEILQRAFAGYAHPDHDRGSETGDLRLPRSRRLQLSGRRPTAPIRSLHSGPELAE